MGLALNGFYATMTVQHPCLALIPPDNFGCAEMTLGAQKRLDSRSTRLSPWRDARCKVVSD